MRENHSFPPDSAVFGRGNLAMRLAEQIIDKPGRADTLLCVRPPFCNRMTGRASKRPICRNSAGINIGGRKMDNYQEILSR